MPFAPEYAALVLTENFEDAKKLFLSPLMAIHSAHLVMLAARGIVTGGDARALRDALDSISQSDVGTQRFDGSVEDLFFLINRLITDRCGEDVAGRLHTARSRNDIDMTMYRMRQRELLLALMDAVAELRQSLADLAERHRETIFAAHTHTQRAQPTTMAHYLLAVIEQLERDFSRLRAAFERTNRCPLGSCAITGTGFPIDRQMTADLLGFDGPTGNTFGSIATVDYLLESISATVILLAGLGRFVQDLLLWSTSEFNYLRIGEGFVQVSSIMPQKRNPVALEHARAIASTGLGQGQAIVTVVHNTPFGDIVDTEDDLQPLVLSVFHDATRSVRLVAAVMASAEFDPARLEQRAAEGWTTLTELADTLVRDADVPFATAHAIAGCMMAASDRESGRPLSELFAEAVKAAGVEVSGAETYTSARLAEILSPRRFVGVRQTPGGPAPSETGRALTASRDLHDRDTAWLRDRRERLTAAERALSVGSRAL
jgi:argininosuccinate lyase